MLNASIKAVIFDFGNVICTFSLHPFLDGIAKKTGTPIAQLWKAMPEIKPLAVEYETGLISSDEFFARMCQCVGIAIDREDFIAAYTNIFTPIEDTLALVRRLKRTHKLGLLSNTNEWHYRYSIRPMDIFPLFDAVTLSFEAKAMKPAPPIFADMLQKLDLPPRECAYIDDLEENIAAAHALGLHAILFTTPDAVAASLCRLGVLADVAAP